MNSTTIILPVSRNTFVDKIFHSLETLRCDKSKTNLFVIVDGSNELFVRVRNLVEESKFAQRLCIQFKSQHVLKHYDIMARRLRISDIHNEIKKHLWDCEFVFGIEDDTIVPDFALQKLHEDFMEYPHAGFIEGVELGRWGVPYVGAWKFDDIYEPKNIRSITPNRFVEEIDAGGFYCFMSRLDTYESHEFKPFDGNSLGPDVNYGISLRNQGYQNYIDWSIKCRHYTKDGYISLQNTEPKIITFRKERERWRQNIL